MLARRIFTGIIGLTFLLTWAVGHAYSGDWESPKELYGNDWDCSRLDIHTPESVYQTCQRCLAGKGTFLFKNAPHGMDARDSDFAAMQGRCDSAGADVGIGNANVPPPAATSPATPTDSSQSSSPELGAQPNGGQPAYQAGDRSGCPDGEMRCYDGKCYAIDNVHSCCEHGGACNRDSICWGVYNDICCKKDQIPTSNGCVGGTTQNSAKKPDEPIHLSWFSLNICNDSDQDVWFVIAAIPTDHRSEFKVSGWYKVEAGACVNQGAYARRKYYVYARSNDKRYKLAGDHSLCIHDKKAFSYFARGGKCSETSVKFVEHTVDDNRNSDTVTFTLN